MKQLYNKLHIFLNAYSLAEIFVTIAIIGVIISTVLPSLLSKGSILSLIIPLVIIGVIILIPFINKNKKTNTNTTYSYKYSHSKKSKNRFKQTQKTKIINKEYFNKIINKIKTQGEKMDKNSIAGKVTILVLFVITILLCNPIVVVGVGERGVKVTLGKVSPTSLGEGVHVIMPYVQRIAKLDVKTQKYNTETHVYTKDIQQAKISYVVNFNLQSDSVHKMYQEVGTDYVTKVINPIIEGNIKDVIGKWNAQDLVANREEATSEIFMKLRDELTPKYVNISTFQIVDINYSEVFEHAIESKVTAEQEALKAKNKTVQIQEEAKQKVISAEAEAKSMSIRANALSKNKALVEYEAVQKWNGVLPEYMMGNSIPFINLNTRSQK